MRARLLRTLGVGTAACLLLATAACGGDEDEAPDAGPASEALGEAVDNFAHGNTGHFTFQVGDDTEALIRTTGSFALIESHHAWQMTLSNGRRSVVTDQHRLEDRAWLRVSRDGSPPDGCWQALSARAAGERTGTPYEQVPTASGRHPALPQAAVVSTAEATGWADDGEGSVVEATTDLYSLAATLGEVVGDLDLSPDTLDARADITVLLDGRGEVVAWRTDLVAVLSSLADAGVTLTDDMEALVETGAAIPVMTGFSDLGDGVDLTTPDGTEVCGSAS